MGIPKVWDKEAGKRMWLAGSTDAEIASAMGVTQATISYFRRKHWEAGEVIPASVAGGEGGNVGGSVNLLGTENPSPTVVERSAVAASAPVRDADLHDTYTPLPTEEAEKDAGYHRMFLALENAIGNLSGMDAVMTAQAIAALWQWREEADLMKAKACLEYLIQSQQKT